MPPPLTHASIFAGTRWSIHSPATWSTSYFERMSSIATSSSVMRSTRC